MRVVICFLILFLCSCGYKTPGTSDRWVGGAAETVYVELFENMTAEPYLDYYITDALVRELSGARFLSLTEDMSAADLLLIGSVDSFRTKALAYGTNDRIAEYSAELSVSVKLTDNAADRLVWKTNLSRTEYFSAPLDKSKQLEGQRLAAMLAAEKIAGDIHALFLNTF